MTDNEIIKALECCVNDTDDICQQCPLFKKCETGDEIKELALDLINRLQKEKG